jgi:hypothetical protein
LAVFRFVTVDFSTVTVRGARRALIWFVKTGAIEFDHDQSGKVRLM